MNVHPPGSLIGGRFEVAGRPLMGGMGIVYVCLDLEDDRPVALKTFRPEYMPDRAARDRFLCEGTTWVELGSHPHVVRCHQVFHPGNAIEVYLVLELVAKEEGRADASLRSWLAPGCPLPAETALLFALQAARGMGHTVAAIPGFVHRDLKPENLLVGADRLASESAANRLRVTDFGLARALGAGEAMPSVGEEEQLPARPGLTRAGRILGTPPYMAPEQWDGPNVDLRADIYALGCILGEMLTGRMLVQERTLHGFCQAHQAGRAAELTKDLPSSLAGVVSRCLSVDRAARYGSWGEVEAALGATYQAVTGRPGPAPEPTAAVGRAERVAAGWSYSAIGSSYLDLGQAETALGYFDRARAVGVAERERPLEGAGLIQRGVAYRDVGDACRAISSCEQALAIAHEIGDRYMEGVALDNLGMAHAARGDAREAIGCYEQALLFSREIGDRPGEGAALGNLGVAYAALGDARRAIDYYEQALAIDREIGDRRGEGVTLGNLGAAYTDLGDARCAISCYERALVIAREIGDRRGEGTALSNLGNVFRELGDARHAIGYYEQVLAIDREIGNRGGEGLALGNLGAAYSDLGEARRSISYCEQALAIARGVGDRRIEGNTLGNLGVAYALLGDAHSAIGYYEQALAIEREIGDRRGEGAFLDSLGIAYAHLGDTRRAVECWQQAAAILEEIRDVMNAVSVGLHLAALLVQQGRHAEALPYAERAAQVFAQIGHAQYAQHAEQLLARIRTALR